MKPPPIPFNKFKNKVIKIGSNSRAIAKKKGNIPSNQASIRTDLNKKSSQKQILAVSTLSQYYYPVSTQLDQHNPLKNWNKANSSEVDGIHSDISTQFLSLAPARSISNTFTQVSRTPTVDQHNALRSKNNLDSNTLKSPKIKDVHADISTQFLSVSSQSPNYNTFAEVERRSTLAQHDALCFLNNIDDSKSMSSRTRSIHTDISTQPSVSKTFKQNPNFNPFAEMTTTSTPSQHNVLNNRNNIDDNKLKSSRIRKVRENTSSVSPRSTCNNYTEVPSISKLKHLNDLHNGNSVDDNKFISCKVGGVNAEIPKQCPPVSLPGQIYNTLAEIRPISNPYQLLHNEDNTADNEWFSSGVNAVQTSAQTHEYAIQREERTENTNQRSSKILNFLCCNII